MTIQIKKYIFLLGLLFAFLLNVYGVPESFLASMPIPLTGKIVYVKQNAVGLNNGTSWNDAFTNLSTALDEASVGDTLWIASGTYLPDSAGGNQLSHFSLTKHLVLLGGFVGDETSESQRNPASNETILSGDLNGNDLAGDLDSNRNDNVYTILLALPTTSAQIPIIDGLIFKGGQAEGPDSDFPFRRGGGIFSYGPLRISNCRFEDHVADADGAAVYFMTPLMNGSYLQKLHFVNNRAGEDGGALMLFEGGTASVIVDSCYFEGNLSFRRGGAVSVLKSSMTVIDSWFQDNECRRNGGAVALIGQDADSLQFQFDGCSFVENRGLTGGAIHFLGNAFFGLFDNRIKINACQFSSNEAIDLGPGNNPRGGALELLFNQQTNLGGIAIADCLFSSNFSEGEGGAVYIRLAGQGTKLMASNTLFAGNTANAGGACLLSGESVGKTTAVFEDCSFTDNRTPEGEGAGLSVESKEQSDLQVALLGASFSDNQQALRGGAISTTTFDAGKLGMQVTSCSFSNNAASQSGGSILAINGNANLRVKIRRSSFSHEKAPEGSVFYGEAAEGGAPVPGSAFVFENCLIIGNEGDKAVFFSRRFFGLQLIHCTVADNATAALRMEEGSQLLLQNSLFFNPGYEEFADTGGMYTVTSFGGNLFGDQSASAISSAFDQLDTDPLFSGIQDFTLSDESPAVDAGVSGWGLPVFDFLGNPRIQGSCVDIGAIESSFDLGGECLVVATEEPVSNVKVIEVFPNPATDFIQLPLLTRENHDDILKVFTLTGQAFFCRATVKMGSTGEELIVDVQSLPSGWYLATGGEGSGRWALRFLKMSNSGL